MSPFIHIYREEWRRGYAIYIQTAEATALPVTLEFKEDGIGSRREPTLFMDNDQGQLQSLMDDLWACGFRPAEAAGSAGQLSATVKHLEDMRKLTFGALKSIIQ